MPKGKRKKPTSRERAMDDIAQATEKWLGKLNFVQVKRRRDGGVTIKPKKTEIPA